MRSFIKKFGAIFVSALLVVMTCMTSLTAFAEGEPSITITNTKTNEDYEFYKVLNLNWSQGAEAADPDDDTYAYTINRDSGSNFDAFFGSLIPNYSVNGTSTAWSSLNDKQKDRAAYDYISALDGDEDSLFAFATAVKRYANTNRINPVATIHGSTGSTQTTEVGTYGYYTMVPVDVSTGKVNDTAAVFSLDSVTPNASFENKSSYPTLEKKIVSGANKVDAVSAAIGDTVNFELTSCLPDISGYITEDGTPFYQYTITDHIAAGFKAPANFEVKIGDNVHGEKVLTENEEYTITTTGSNDRTFVINFTVDSDEDGEPDISLADWVGYTEDTDDDGTDDIELAEGSKITVTYNAVVDTDAVIGVNGNFNDAQLTFSSNPAKVYDASDATTYDVTPVDETKVYVGAIQLKKTDANGAPLAGAQFTITGANLNKINVTNNGVKTDDIDASSGYTFTTGDDGTVIIEGLKEGTYTLVENTAPNGYQAIDGTITVTLDCTEPGTVVPGSDLNGGATVCQFVNANNTAVASDEDLSPISGKTVNNKGIVFDIINRAQSRLPATGAIGLAALGVVGTVSLAGAMLAGKRRKENE